MNSVCELRDATGSFNFGGKAANLARMLKTGLPVPDGIAVGLNAFEDDGKLNDEASQQIQELISKDKLYAVRSSALAEDAEDASWAGQFETFLDTKPEDVTAKVEECHNSAKNRAKEYAKDKAIGDFKIAVVVQEMLKPDYAGVLFTQDPLTRKNTLLTEYVSGLGEELVSGRADPTRVILNSDEAKHAPFDAAKLAELAIKVEQLFGTPQDIEWVWAGNKLWLVQSRPITATQSLRAGYYLGETEDLFYWGPSRAKPVYMSDFMVAAQQFLLWSYGTEEMPNPPKTLVLFCEVKMVWLSNAQAFADFTEQTFNVYEKLCRLEEDIINWHNLCEKLAGLKGEELNTTLVDAWYSTEFAEFALYGAEASLAKRLARFDAGTRQEIWGAFTTPGKPTFLSRIDNELVASQNPAEMAQKYTWIEDGYDGVSSSAEQYFTKRLAVVGNSNTLQTDNIEKRSKLAERLQLSQEELSALSLARQLAEFMDDRKAWMMQTRRLIQQSVSNIEHGWFYNDGKAELINEDDTRDLWQRYVDFKAASSMVIGIVASNGGRHFINGEVVIVASPTDIVEDDKILVVPSTSPSYVPLMRKAKALITDHGGMMSHAAIVAREFNLPCIVSTKQATKVLKTGDNVVLDLLKGEVNK